MNVGGSGPDQAYGINIASQRLKHATSRDGTLSFAGVRANVDIGHPFNVRMRWDAGGGHAVVCTGYRYSDSSMLIMDPWENTLTQFYPYNNLIEGTPTATSTGRYHATVTY